METLLHNPTERVTNILKIIAKNSDKLNFSSISKLTNMPKSTLSPILKTLVELEFLVLNPISQTYSIGLATFQIGQAYLENVNGLEIIKSHMRSIVAQCNETCQIGINHNNEVLYLTKVECSLPIKLMSSIGRNLPLYCTGLGRVLLCEYSEDEIRNLYSNGMNQFTENTVTDIEELLEIVKKAKINKFAEEFGEVTSDACCIAVPIMINNKINAAMGVSLPIFRANQEEVLKIKNLLKEHSLLISKELENLNIKSII